MSEASDEYQDLYDFFAGWIAEADLEGASDEEQLRAYLRTEDPGVALRARNQLVKILGLRRLPFSDIRDEANRSFRDEEETRAWLQSLLAAWDRTAEHQ